MINGPGGYAAVTDGQLPAKVSESAAALPAETA